MNEQIKLLEKQCWSHRVDGVLVDGHLHFDTKKFAELIVKECAGVTLDYKNHDHYTGWCDHAAEILKHFGVKE
jgi:hypothetical protein